jgi:exonuclease III
MTIKLLSWNVAGRVNSLPRQVESIKEVDPEIIALQEVTPRTEPMFCSYLSQAGYEFILTSFQLADPSEERKGARLYGELTASRFPLTPLPPADFQIEWRERVLSAVVESPLGPIELHNAHIPCGSSHGWTKIDTFEGIYQRLAKASEIPRILCGDFNSPQAEFADGTVVTWGQSIWKNGTVKTIGDERWARGEWNVIAGLADYDLVDIYRFVNGYSAQEISWSAKRKGVEYGRRFDHVFGSRKFVYKSCGYLHKFRQTGLSDHSPIIVEFYKQ